MHRFKGNYLPLSVYKSQGYDVKDIEQNCNDVKDHPVLGKVYRVLIEGAGKELEETRQKGETYKGTRKVHKRKRDDDDDDSEDGSSSSSSSSSEKKGKKKKGKSKKDNKKKKKEAKKAKKAREAAAKEAKAAREEARAQAKEIALNRKNAAKNMSMLITSLKPFIDFVKTAGKASPGTLPTWALDKAKELSEKLTNAQKSSAACMQGKAAEVPDPSDVKDILAGAQTLQKTMADLLCAAGNHA